MYNYMYFHDQLLLNITTVKTMILYSLSLRNYFTAIINTIQTKIPNKRWIRLFCGKYPYYANLRWEHLSYLKKNTKWNHQWTERSQKNKIIIRNMQIKADHILNTKNETNRTLPNKRKLAECGPLSAASDYRDHHHFHRSRPSSSSSTFMSNAKLTRRRVTNLKTNYWFSERPWLISAE